MSPRCFIFLTSFGLMWGSLCDAYGVPFLACLAGGMIVGVATSLTKL